MTDEWMLSNQSLLAADPVPRIAASHRRAISSLLSLSAIH